MLHSSNSLLKKMLIAGGPAGLLMIFLSAITSGANISAYISNPLLDIRSWTISVLAYNLMIGFILAIVYDGIHTGLKGNNPITKGLLYGILIWLVHSLPASVNSFIQNPLLVDLIRLELISGFVSYPLVCLLIAIIYDRYIFN